MTADIAILIVSLAVTALSLADLVRTTRSWRRTRGEQKRVQKEFEDAMFAASRLGTGINERGGEKRFSAGGSANVSKESSQKTLASLDSTFAAGHGKPGISWNLSFGKQVSGKSYNKGIG